MSGMKLKTIVCVPFLVFGFTALAEKQDLTYDAQFLDKTSEYHRLGIEIAKMGTRKAQLPPLKAMSRKMLKNQRAEINKIQAWRNQEFSQVPRLINPSTPLDITSLSQKKGTEFDRSYVELLTQHHLQAFEVATEAETRAVSPKVRDFAKELAKRHSTEAENLRKIQKNIFR
ncbi:MAG: DUF305 domain-containing protein [Bdellovibrionales bacterium]